MDRLSSHTGCGVVQKRGVHQGRFGFEFKDFEGWCVCLCTCVWCLLLAAVAVCVCVRVRLSSAHSGACVNASCLSQLCPMSVYVSVSVCPYVARNLSTRSGGVSGGSDVNFFQILRE